jgi:tRNA(fMet)-specific endonuclease VapC
LKYLLDTNACIALINGRPAGVRTRFQAAIARGAEVSVSGVVLFELWYGVAKSEQLESNTSRMESFLAGPISLLSFDEEDARVAGRIRATLEKIGRPIGAYDLLIAGQAIHHKLTLVTANGKEFTRVKGLVCEDWVKP